MQIEIEKMEGENDVIQNVGEIKKMKILFRISNSPEGVRMEKEFLYPCRILKKSYGYLFFKISTVKFF